MSFLKISNLRKSYGSLEILKDINIEIEQGGFLVLVGPSGCGKSTLLNTIAGLEPITSGDIAIDGRSVAGLHPSKRDIAMVFQDYALYPHMNVAENMGFSLAYRGVKKPEIARRVSEAAAVLDIAHLLARRPRELSGGQRQRVAMGRAMVRDPKVFLFDEPLSNLDAKLRVQMRTEIKKLRDRLRATTIYVTHDQVEAMTLADRIVVLRGGHIEQLGTPEEIYDRPASTFVAGFMGAPAMNQLPVTIAAGRAVLPDGTALPMAAPPARITEAMLGLRPERLAWLAPDAPANGAELTGRATVVEPLGAETLVTLDIAGHELHARVPPRSVRVAGEQVRLAIDPSDLHLFARDGGQRL